MEETPTPEEIERRKQWFAWYTNQLDNHSIQTPQEEGVSYGCPCCGYLTLSERGAFEICDVCFWEDDGQDDHDADIIRGGPNRDLSLTQARQNYQEFGASEQRLLPHVRPPLPEELPK